MYSRLSCRRWFLLANSIARLDSCYGGVNFLIGYESMYEYSCLTAPLAVTQAAAHFSAISDS
jgi:hypothetical protein